MYRVKFINGKGTAMAFPVANVREGQLKALAWGAQVYRVYHNGSLVYELTHSLRRSA